METNKEEGSTRMKATYFQEIKVGDCKTTDLSMRNVCRIIIDIWQLWKVAAAPGRTRHAGNTIQRLPRIVKRHQCTMSVELHAVAIQSNFR